MKIAIIGAGPAGITAAYLLNKNNYEVHLYEAENKVGGFAKSIELWNQTVDLGPHRFFSSDAVVNKLWLEVAQNDYEMVNRLTRIYYKNKFFYYPVKAGNALSKLGFIEASTCVLSYFKERLLPTKNDGSFETWVTNKFGKRLYEIFFKTYSEKLWGVKCTDLDADFAAQRIKKLSMLEVLKSALFGGNKTKHKTLVEQFAYPIKGAGMIYSKMATAIEKNSGKIFLNTPVKRVITKNKCAYAIELENGEIKEYDHIISTMPMSLLVERLEDVPENILSLNKLLRYRNTILVYLNVQATNLFSDQWLYVHSTDLLFGRLTNFRNWLPSLYGDEKSSILCLEYWCNTEDDFWKKPNDEIIEIAKQEIRKTNLIKNAEISHAHVHRMQRCYPVYYRGYKENLKPIEEYLSTIKNLQIIGRYGAYKYNNQDHSILMGIMAAENIIENKNHNLWSINTDYENYQEKAIITKTGLVAQ